MCAHTHELIGSVVFTIPGQRVVGGEREAASFCRAPGTGIWVKDTRDIGRALIRPVTQILQHMLFNGKKESCQIGRLNVIFLS